jgi:PKD repeat protein
MLVTGLAVVACERATGPAYEAPLVEAASGEVVPGQYIVVLRDGQEDPADIAEELALRHGGRLLMSYRRAIRGFAARLDPEALEAVRRNPRVLYVEPDREAQLVATQENPPSWGIDRVDQADLPLDASYAYGNDGSGANIYIFDTGVRRTHNDFGGRVQFVPNGSNGDFVGDGHGNAEDCHGHGTHVAGTAAGNAYGLAKNAPIWAARVVNCSGSGQASMAIAAVDWATANAVRPAVVNMSLGYGNVQSLRDAVQNSVAAGVMYSVAAGNGHWLFGFPVDACNESPAGAFSALTVGATQSNDVEASFSNYGPCVDLLAPGVSITSAYYSSDNATAVMSGTSMATPHVTGAVALYLTANPGATSAQVAQALKNNATPNRITLHSRSASRGTPNLLLYTGFIGGGNEPPTASFTVACTDLSCNFTDSSTDADGSLTAWSWEFGDGRASSAQNPSHSYVAEGTYAVTLTVTDDAGGTDIVTVSVTVTAPAGNDPPVASFDVACTYLTCDFTDTSMDSDGSVAAWSWDFGDGATSTAQHLSHTYGAAGDYTVTLTVTDNSGATDAVSQTVSASEPPNQAPTASFSYSCDYLTCEFTDTSSDADGIVNWWQWDFGDGASSGSQHPFRQYGAEGTYTVTLTVWDDDNASDVVSQQVTVTAPPPSNITLTATPGRFWYWWRVDLRWNGATSANVDVYLQGIHIARTANDGFYRDYLLGSGTYAYKVCEAGTLVCSNDATVTF